MRHRDLSAAAAGRGRELYECEGRYLAFSPLNRILALFGLSVLAAAILLAAPGAPRAQGVGELSPEQRAAFFQSLTPNERQIFFTLSPEEKQKFIAEKLKAAPKGSAQASTPPSGTPQSGRPQSSGSQGGRPPGGTPGGGFRGPPTLVELAKVERERLVQYFPVTGRVVARQHGVIASRIQGRVVSVMVDVGDRVKAGDVIAELDTGRLKLEAELRAAEVIQARAKWHAAQAQVDLLNQELKRLESLRNSAAFNPARLEDKKQEVVKAMAAVDENAAALRRARAQRDLARLDLHDAVIRAAYPGAITVRHVSPGAFVNPGAPIVTLLDDESVEIEADVPSARIGGLTPGMEVDIAINADVKIHAAVRAIIPDENPLARTRAVRLTPDVSNLKKALVTNQSVTVQVPQGEARDVIAVPKDAIVNRQVGPTVFVFENGRVRPQIVEIGQSFAGKFEVKGGLAAGQQVVVTGNELLRPGQAVRIHDGGGPGAGPGDETRNGTGGPQTGGSPAVGAMIRNLSNEERQKFFAMSPEEKGAFIRKKLGDAGAPSGDQRSGS
jgi:RND family efflux transporter MFP subunit